MKRAGPGGGGGALVCPGPREITFWGREASLSPGPESWAPPDRPGPRNMITGPQTQRPRPRRAPARRPGPRVGAVCECLAAARRHGV